MSDGGDSDAEIAAYQLSQLLASVTERAAEVISAAQGPAALCLSYGASPPGPAEVPWLRFASRRKPVFAWATAAVNVVVSGWRVVTSWATGIFGGLLLLFFRAYFLGVFSSKYGAFVRWLTAQFLGLLLVVWGVPCSSPRGGCSLVYLFSCD